MQASQAKQDLVKVRPLGVSFLNVNKTVLTNILFTNIYTLIKLFVYIILVVHKNLF